MNKNAFVIGNNTVQKFITVDDVIECVENTWKWYGNGEIVMPPKITTDMSSKGVDGWFNAMPCYIAPMHSAGIKVVGGYPGNHKIGLPYIKANVLLTDPETGCLRALVNGDWISDMRTGAQPAIMAKYLASKTDVITIIGTGLQGSSSLLCMSKLLEIKEVRVCDLSAEARKNFITKFEKFPFKMEEYESNEKACMESDIIVTVTTANAELVKEPWVKNGALVMTMGSFRETDLDLIRKADMLAVDHPEQALHRGNFKEMAELGEIDLNSFGAVLPDVIAGKQKGRTNPDDRICAEIVGMGCPDVAIATLVYNKVLELGKGVTAVNMDE